jgi:hypothetical protein
MNFSFFQFERSRITRETVSAGSFNAPGSRLSARREAGLFNFPPPD